MIISFKSSSLLNSLGRTRKHTSSRMAFIFSEYWNTQNNNMNMPTNLMNYEERLGYLHFLKNLPSSHAWWLLIQMLTKLPIEERERERERERAGETEFTSGKRRNEGRQVETKKWLWMWLMWERRLWWLFHIFFRFSMFGIGPALPTTLLVRVFSGTWPTIQVSLSQLHLHHGIHFRG